MKNKILILLMITPILIQPSSVKEKNVEDFNEEFKKCTEKENLSKYFCFKNLLRQIRNEQKEKQKIYDSLLKEDVNPIQRCDRTSERLTVWGKIKALENLANKCLDKMK